MTFLSKREIIDLIEQITNCQDKSEEEIDRLIDWNKAFSTHRFRIMSSGAT